MPTEVDCCDDGRDWVYKRYIKSDDKYEYYINFHDWDSEYKRVYFCPFCGKRLKEKN